MIEELFHYQTRHNLVNGVTLTTEQLQGAAKCRVRVNGQTVISTELHDNSGLSVTNAAGELATQVAAHYEIPPDKLIWIEHYSDESYSSRMEKPGQEPETFDRVCFTLRGAQLTDPEWRRITREEAMSLLGDC